MLRLTTNVATSPLSSRAQAIGPGANLLDRLGPLLTEQRDELGARKLMAVGGPLHRPRREVSVADRGCGAIAVAVGGHRFPARHERRETVRDRPEHRRLHPIPVHVLRIDAEPLGERVAERAQALADLQRTRERMLGGNVIAVGREAAEVVAPPRRGRPTNRRGSAAPGCRRRASPSGTRRRGASCRRARSVTPRRASRDRPRPRLNSLGAAALGGLLGDVRYLRPVVARMGDEVLQDHLLDVSVPLLHGRQRLEARPTRSSSDSPIPTRIRS